MAAGAPPVPAAAAAAFAAATAAARCRASASNAATTGVHTHRLENDAAAALARRAADRRLDDFSSSAFSSHPPWVSSHVDRLRRYGAALPATVLPVAGSHTVTCSSSMLEKEPA